MAGRTSGAGGVDGAAAISVGVAGAATSFDGAGTPSAMSATMSSAVVFAAASPFGMGTRMTSPLVSWPSGEP